MSSLTFKPRRTRSSEDEESQEKGQVEMQHVWVISFSDFMTILMVFFLILYHAVLVDPSLRQKRAYVGTQEEQDMPSLHHAIRRIGRTVTSREKYRKPGTELTENILFEPDRAELTVHHRRLLDRVAEGLRRYPGTVVVEGYTDDREGGGWRNYAQRLMLAVQRAQAGVRYLTEERGLPPAKVSVRGFGPYRPVGDNRAEEGRALNRRIEIVLIPAATPPSPPRATKPAEPTSWWQRALIQLNSFIVNLSKHMSRWVSR